MVIQSRDMPSAFYSATQNADGSYDVELVLDIAPSPIIEGWHAILTRSIKGVKWNDEDGSIEEHLREHYGAWCAIASAVGV